MSITIKDIAERAGVGIGTVSRYINKKGYVSKEKRKIIEETIRKLNYQPNEIARSLNSRSSKFIGFLIPTILNPFFTVAVNRIENLLWSKGYKLIICNVEGDLQKEKEYVKFLEQHYAAGIIVATNSSDDEFFKNIKIPMVAFDRIINEEIPYVVSANREGGRIAAKTLIEKKCNNILYISGDININSAKYRLKGFLEEMDLHENVNYNILYTDDETKVEKNVLVEQLKQSEYDGVVIWNEKTASNALITFQQLGIKIPDKMQIITFDGLEIGESTLPKLTTIKQQIVEMTEKVVEILVALIEDKEEVKVDNIFDMEVVYRETTK